MWKITTIFFFLIFDFQNFDNVMLNLCKAFIELSLYILGFIMDLSWLYVGKMRLSFWWDVSQTLKPH